MNPTAIYITNAVVCVLVTGASLAAVIAGKVEWPIAAGFAGSLIAALLTPSALHVALAQKNVASE